MSTFKLSPDVPIYDDHAEYPLDSLEILDRAQAAATKLKYNEHLYLDDILAYIKSTYGAHYSGDNGVQAFDLVASSGNAEGFCLGSIIKYASRWGKKDGYQRKDLLKIAHYVLLLLWVMDNKKGE